MAITMVQEVPGAEGSLGLENKSFTRRYIVVADDWDISAYDVMYATGIPRKGQVYPALNAAYVQEVQAVQREDSPAVWDITVSYSDQVDGATIDDDELPPLQRTPQYSYSVVARTKPATVWKEFLNPSLLNDNTVPGNVVSPWDENRSYTNYPITNSAGEPFVGLTTEVYNSVITVVRNEANFDVAFAREYTDTINNAEYFGHPKWSVRITGITTGGAQTEQNQSFFPVTYTLEIDYDLWIDQLLDHGTKALDPNNVTIKHDLKRDELLNGQGAVNKNDQGNVTLYYRYGRRKTQKNFQTLNLF